MITLKFSEDNAFRKAIEDAIANDKFVVALVSSRTQASFESEGTQFGAGKTTLAMWLSWHFSRFDVETKRYYDDALDPTIMSTWDMVFDNMWYYYPDIREALDIAKEKRQRVSVGIWDDPQLSAPAQSGTPRDLPEFVGRLTGERLAIAFLILAAPSMNSIHKSIRPLIQFEFIVPERGHFEIQTIDYRKNFANPQKDIVKMRYISGKDPREKRAPDYDPLPPHVKERYDSWRIAQMLRKRGRRLAPRTESVVPQAQTVKTGYTFA